MHTDTLSSLYRNTVRPIHKISDDLENLTLQSDDAYNAPEGPPIYTALLHGILT